MSEMPSPRTLIVTQVIFGRPLRNEPTFYAGEVDRFTAVVIGQGNASKVIGRLLETGWIERATPAHPTRPTGGRPPTYYFRRTARGMSEYQRLVETLKRFGIELR